MMHTTFTQTPHKAGVKTPAQDNEIVSDIGELRAENDRLTLELNQMRLRLLDIERTADTDPLVAVYNRRAFIREVEKARTVMTRYDILSSVIFFDLNGFKSINDRFGHSIA
jgi:GGDEF domain-containing protein